MPSNDFTTTAEEKLDSLADNVSPEEQMRVIKESFDLLKASLDSLENSMDAIATARKLRLKRIKSTFL